MIVSGFFASHGSECSTLSMDCNSRPATMDIRTTFAKLEGNMILLGFLAIVVVGGKVPFVA